MYNEKEYMNKYWKDHKDKKRIYNKKYYENHKEIAKIYFKNYHKENKEKLNMSSNKYREEHKDFMKDYYKNYVKEYNLILREKVLEHYGHKCACCGETEDHFLTIDHINGGGSKHMKEIGGNLYRWLVKNNFPEGFQILCWNCNCAKGKYGICPHKEKREEID